MKIQFRKNEKLAYMAVAGVVILLLLAGVLLNWQRGAFTNNMLLLLSLLLGVGISAFADPPLLFSTETLETFSPRSSCQPILSRKLA